MSSIFICEDDYLGIEVVPVENLEFCRKQAELIREFALEHRAEIGFTDSYTKKGPPLSLCDKRIPTHLFDTIVGEYFPKFDAVYVVDYLKYSNEPAKYIHAYGKSENVVVFYDIENSFIEHIWLDLNIRTDEDIIDAKDLFKCLSKLGDLIIDDSGWCFVERVDCSEIIEVYLQERLKAFGQAR